MSDATDKDPRLPAGARAKKPARHINPAGTTSRSRSSGEVGKALRSVYDVTLGERVPDDFLDLLGKLS